MEVINIADKQSKKAAEYQESADDLFLFYQSFVKAGFTEDQAFEVFMSLIQEDYYE